MPETPSVTFSLLGARQHYQPIITALEVGWLDRLITDLWIPWARILPQSNSRRGLSWLRRAAGRYDPRIPAHKIRTLTAIGLRYKWMLDRARTPTEMYAAFETMGSRFATRACRLIPDSSNVFFGYTGASLETLRHASSRGIGTILDQIDAGRTGYDIILEEEKRFPDLAASPAPPPERYFGRMAEEWEVATTILVNSGWSKQALRLQGVPADKLIVAPLAFEPPGHGAPRDHWHRKLRVLWLGTLCLGKGLPYALEAANRLLREPVEFTFAGPLEVRAEHLHFPRNARYLGALPRKLASNLYNEHDVFIFPTLSDGFGLTQVEAIAHGLPVIATRCCGEVVEQGESGMLIPPRDSRSLADAILRFVEDRDVLPRMSRNALKRTEDFTPAAVWPHYASVLQGSQGSQLACAPPGKSV